MVTDIGLQFSFLRLKEVLVMYCGNSRSILIGWRKGGI